MKFLVNINLTFFPQGCECILTQFMSDCRIHFVDKICEIEYRDRNFMKE